MFTLSFMSANWVARQLGYHMTKGWGEGDAATNAYFQPPDTFSDRFDGILSEVRRLGFEAFDLWTGHLNWRWATQEHIETARTLIAKHGLEVMSYAGGFGDTEEEFRTACDLAAKLEIPILGGNSGFLAKDKRSFGSVLKAHGLKFGLENHPEKTPDEVLAKIAGLDEELVGTCIDTGWFGTHGYDAAKAINALRDHLFHVHLKDVLRPGGHVTCGLGKGCVPIERCVRELESMQYLGGISIEHEPEDHDPGDECRTSRELVEELMRRG